MYVLYISGFVQEEKTRELEQTFKQIQLKKPRASPEFHLSIEFHNPSLYHFFVFWPKESEMVEFMNSTDFQMITNAFQILGFIHKRYAAELFFLSQQNIAESKSDEWKE
jgi:hypothetical protein